VISESQRLSPTNRSVFVADVKCHLCGTVAGTIECEQPAGGRQVLFRQAGQQQARPITAWWRLRCARCGGPMFLEDADVVTRRVESADWVDEKPRRGRPPKRLVEQRRRMELELEMQLERSAGIAAA
jgi:hypothetical protein